MFLRRRGPEGLDRRRADRNAPQEWRDGLHHRDHRGGQRSGTVAVRRALRRLRDGRILHVQRPARPDRLRRPLETGGRLSATVAVDATSAGTRGLSGRRVLLPQSFAGTRLEALRRVGRRFAHRAADRRNARRRSVGLHPDQRDFDHRRPDLLTARPVLLRATSGHERGHFGFTGRRGGPGGGP